MGKIEETIESGANQKWAREQLENAKGLVQTGPLAIGEDHTRPEGRAILWDLISAGKVKRLFTEQTNNRLENGLTVEKNLQTLATPVPDEVTIIRYSVPGQTESSMGTAIETHYQRQEELNKSAGRATPLITYAALMQHAVRHGVVVYCYDKDVTSFEKRQIRYAGGDPDVAALDMRNEHMATRYLGVHDRNEPGTVLFGGADHFDHSKSPNPHLGERVKLAATHYIECP